MNYKVRDNHHLLEKLSGPSGRDTSMVCFVPKEESLSNLHIRKSYFTSLLLLMLFYFLLYVKLITYYLLAIINRLRRSPEINNIYTISMM